MDEKALIAACLAGNRQSLETLIGSIQEQIFNLAMRFLWHREDAEDATQEILVKLITNLSKFGGKSKFSTWAYRVATNYLINLKQTRLEGAFSSFEVFAQDLRTVKNTADYGLPDQDLMVKEVKTGCTLAMLQCLDRNLRMAFILGSVLNIKSSVAAEITDTTPANFRKRLELARKRIGTFLQGHCGVYNPQNACRCPKRIHDAQASGRVQPGNMNFVGADKVAQYNEEMEELNSMAGIYHNHGHFRGNTDFAKQLGAMLASKQILDGESRPGLGG